MSKDFLNNVYAHTNNRKRKMKEAVVEHPPPPPPPQFASAPPAAPLSLFPLDSGAGASSSAARPTPLASHFDTALRLSSVESGRQQMAAAAGGGGDLGALSRPIKSFTSLLLTGDGNNEAAAVEDGTHRIIKHAVTIYSERVREMMEEMCMQQHAVEHAMAEERATKKMKENYDEMMGRVMARNSELERLLSNYRNQAMNMGHRMKTLEQTNASLRVALHQATASFRGSGGGEEMMMLVRQHHQPPQPPVAEEEDAQSSSSVDPEQSGRSVRLTCRVCSRRIATVMLWPCRHLCLCKRCEVFANRCPVCNAVFQANIEVDLSG